MTARILAFLFVVLATSGCEKSQPEQPANLAMPSGFQPGFTHIVNTYLKLKDALVIEDLEQAKQHASVFAAAIDSIDLSDIDSAKLPKWTEIYNRLSPAIALVQSGDDVASKREAFLPLSDVFIDAVSEFHTSGTPLYVQHCPMAFDNSGGDWLSDSKEILNPYFGDVMLNCGFVSQTLAAE